MPYLPASTYRPPWFLKGGHAQTIYPALFRKVAAVPMVRERLELADGDFLDLDWLRGGHDRLAILSHGLEASSRAPYIRSMATALARRGWDVLAWNYRGCGGQPNRLLRFYHSGATEDLAEVVHHALASHGAARIDLLGFSLGGNLTLKYLGEQGPTINPRVGGAVAFSVPCDLASSSVKLSKRTNRVYMDRFMRDLRAKLRAKKPAFPDQIDLTGIGRIRTFRQFDDRFTAPLHGFSDAADYWERASSRPWLPRITVPALLVNAVNDPFLGDRCFPREEAEASAHFHFEAPADGGHVGFAGADANGEYWTEKRAAAFLTGQHG